MFHLLTTQFREINAVPFLILISPFEFINKNETYLASTNMDTNNQNTMQIVVHNCGFHIIRIFLYQATRGVPSIRTFLNGLILHYLGAVAPSTPPSRDRPVACTCLVFSVPISIVIVSAVHSYIMYSYTVHVCVRILFNIQSLTRIPPRL